LSPSPAIKLMQRVRGTGSAAPARYGGHSRPLLDSCEATLPSRRGDLQADLERCFGVVDGLSTIHSMLRPLCLA
jgi:hypothetical protein